MRWRQKFCPYPLGGWLFAFIMSLLTITPTRKWWAAQAGLFIVMLVLGFVTARL